MESVVIPIEGIKLEGMLSIPMGASSLVIFSHGSGNGRSNLHNNFIAQHFLKKNISSLLIDLLSKDEERAYGDWFDIDILTKRLIEVTLWMKTYPPVKKLALGYFGASTGAASALIASAQLPETINAVVMRSGRPDLVLNEDLTRVRAPILFIVGEFDRDVIMRNRIAFHKIDSPTKLVTVPGASHLFDEPGTLEQVADNASSWFDRYLTKDKRLKANGVS